jgi:hypothetical protein
MRWLFCTGPTPVMLPLRVTIVPESSAGSRSTSIFEVFRLIPTPTFGTMRRSSIDLVFQPMAAIAPRQTSNACSTGSWRLRASVSLDIAETLSPENARLQPSTSRLAWVELALAHPPPFGANPIVRAALASPTAPMPLSLSERLVPGSVSSGRSVWLSAGGGLTLFVAVDQVV